MAKTQLHLYGGPGQPWSFSAKTAAATLSVLLIQPNQFLSHDLDGQKIYAIARDASDEKVTGVTSPAITISKNCAAFANPVDGSWAEIANGVYSITLDGEDVDTLGVLLVSVIHGSMQDLIIPCQIAVDPEDIRKEHLHTLTLL